MAAACDQAPTPEELARVWRFTVDGRAVTAIASERVSIAEMSQELFIKFGGDRVKQLVPQ